MKAIMSSKLSKVILTIPREIKKEKLEKVVKMVKEQAFQKFGHLNYRIQIKRNLIHSKNKKEKVMERRANS